MQRPPGLTRTVLVPGVGAVVATVAAVAVAITSAAGSSASETGEEATDGTPATAEVVRTDLVRTETFPGSLGFGEARAVQAASDGVVTSVVAEGGAVTAGAVVYAVDAEPTVLLTGAVPAYRELSEDASDGLDVAQLEQALVELGLGDGVSVDGDFDDATADAVAAWEETLGRSDPDGVVQLGEILFAAGAVQVASVEAPVGARVREGDTILTATGTGKVVDLDVAVDRADDIVAGTPVDIELPDGSTAAGSVSGVATVTDTDAATGEETVAVVVLFDTTADGADPAACCTAGPVDVVIERSREEGVLAVPVTALLALAEGGYAVEVVDADGGTGLVAVDTGTFTDDLVAVSGTGLAAGMTVVVAG